MAFSASRVPFTAATKPSLALSNENVMLAAESKYPTMYTASESKLIARYCGIFSPVAAVVSWVVSFGSPGKRTLYRPSGELYLIQPVWPCSANGSAAISSTSKVIDAFFIRLLSKVQCGDSALRKSRPGRRLPAIFPRCTREGKAIPWLCCLDGTSAGSGAGGPRGRLEDGERGALRVGDDGHSSDIFEIGGRHVELCAKLLGLGGGGVTIGNSEIRQPMRRDSRLAMRGGRNAPDEFLAILYMPVIVSGVFVFLHHLPAEEFGIKLARPRLVRCAQVSPAECAVHARDSSSHMFVGLPDGENRPCRVLEICHAAGIENVERRGQHLAAELAGSVGGVIGALDADVQVPMRRNAPGALLRVKGIGCAGVASLELEHAVETVRAYRGVRGSPAENLAVESFCGGLVGGGEFGPAERPGGVLFDMRHGRDYTPAAEDGEEARLAGREASPGA